MPGKMDVNPIRQTIKSSVAPALGKFEKVRYPGTATVGSEET
jgi:hypothetical protein